MNIFFLDEDKEKAARHHIDKHIIKMPLETAQITCTACHLNDVPEEWVPYIPTHTNHPCIKWAAESRANIEWLVEFGYELCREYTHRYDKTHKCEWKVFDWFTENNIQKYFPKNGLTERPLAMPDKYKFEDPVQSYRLYYIMEKKDIAEWTNRDSPDWW